MGDIIVDGKTKVWFVPTIANIAAPTVAEITAGTSLEHQLTADGLSGFAPKTADVDNTALDSTFDTVLPGRSSYSNTMLTLKKQSGATDAVWTALSVRDTAGYIVIRDGAPVSQALAAADKVQVYPVVLGEWGYLDRAKNSVLKYAVETKISGTPNQKAVVAA